MATSIPARRFNGESIEITEAMYKNMDGPKCSRFAPNPVETTTRTNRRSAVEPINIAVRSSQGTSLEEEERTERPAISTLGPVKTAVNNHDSFRDQPTPGATSPKKARRFAPELIETSTKTNRPSSSEPSETSVRRSRKKFAEEWDSQTANTVKKERKPRKCAPLVIETARRSRRAGDSSLSHRQFNTTEATPLECSEQIPGPPDNTPTYDFSQNPLFLEIQRATSPLNRKRISWCRPAHHCFHVPDLEPIESSESEGSVPASPMKSSFLNRPCLHEQSSKKEPTRIRECVDERPSGYLLELAAKAAEKQLRDQAMAAFPNEDPYEHVDHFVDRDDDSDACMSRIQSREGSIFSEVNRGLHAMRQHNENAEKEGVELEACPKSHPFRKPAAPVDSATKDVIGGYQKNSELDRMRRDAAPPLLGKDIRFPRCHSPEPARFDTTQGCDAVRIAMCYLSEQSQQEAEKGESLWCGQGNGKNASRVSSLWSTASASSGRESKNGLWSGCCVSSGDDAPKRPPGILTPRVGTEDLLSPCPTPSASLLPPTPPASTADFACIDEKLSFALSIDEDYGDDFVTQVYNYLSLGYPSMAQPFDEELSKISNIPIAELRQDDFLAKSRGYIRLGEDGNLTSADITEESCVRWRALRVYIREWAKQHPNMSNDSLTTGGIAARKGSWAV